MGIDRLRRIGRNFWEFEKNFEKMRNLSFGKIVLIIREDNQHHAGAAERDRLKIC